MIVDGRLFGKSAVSFLTKLLENYFETCPLRSIVVRIARIFYPRDDA